MKNRVIVAVCALALALSACGNQRDLVGENNLSPQNPAPEERFRSIDGTGNAPENAGSAGHQLLRLIPAQYSDGISSPAGASRLSPREISNFICPQENSMPDPGGRSDFVWCWGQFLDHDITLTLTGEERLPVPVPTGDSQFDPLSLGNRTISFRRSQPDPSTGTSEQNPREFLNDITAFIDGSMVYGSNAELAAALRTFEGGKLKTSDGNFPPFNREGFEIENASNLPDDQLFLCGDKRANEHLALTTLHTLFLREHNRWAEELAELHPDWSDERLYQRARKIVGAEIQAITYNEFLPVLLGPGALPEYSGYVEGLDPGIDSLFSTAAFRLGHTLVSPTLLRLGPDGTPIPEGSIPVREGFFEPHRLLSEGGIDPILRGLAQGRMQSLDPHVVDELRNFLFFLPGFGGLDLVSLNIQRGRDHGLPDYNTVREFFGLGRVTDFSEITREEKRLKTLQSAYSSVDDIDLWIGLVTEDHMDGAVVGPTLRAILVDQFSRLRDGDRFFYLNDPSLEPLLPELESTRLSTIVARNSGARLQQNVFFSTL